MGFLSSLLGYNSHNSPYPCSEGYLHQQARGPRLGVPTHGPGIDQSSPAPMLDLSTRLAALEKDYEICRAENVKKEAVIQYLLHAKISNRMANKKAEELQDEVSSLKKKNAELSKNGEQLRTQLRESLDTIFTLCISKVNAITAPPASSISTDKKGSSKDGVAETHNLIDLLGPFEGSIDAELPLGNTTLVEDHDGDKRSSDDRFKNKIPYQSLSSLSNSDWTDSNYIHHFLDSNDEVKTQGPPKNPEHNLQPCKDAVEAPEQHSALAALIDFDNSSLETSPFSSGLVSTSTSFSSSSANDTSAVLISNEILAEGLLAASVLRSNGYSPLPVRSTSEEFTAPLSISPEPQEPYVPAKMGGAEPRWTTSQLFDSELERNHAILINQREAGAKDPRFPDLFRHGIRFTPDSSERNIYRTVKISGLPSDITMMKLMDRIRGGMVVDAKLLDTNTVTGGKTGLVTFLNEHSAMAYEEFAKEYPISFDGIIAHIGVISTPTWPISLSLRKSIYDFDHTRCLEIHKFPQSVSSAVLIKELAVSPVLKINGLESMSMSESGVLGLRFTSVRFAGQASAMFNCVHRYRGCSARFVPDPCARPLETLLDEGKVEVSNVNQTCPVLTNIIDPQLTAMQENEIESYRTDAVDSIASDIIDPGLTTAQMETGRLAKVEWESEPEPSYGRELEEE